MKKGILQIWKEQSGKEYLQDGCSIHLDIESHKKYSDKVKSDSNLREFGDYSEVYISDTLYRILKKDKLIRLRTNEMNNLVNLDEIISL